MSRVPLTWREISRRCLILLACVCLSITSITSGTAKAAPTEEMSYQFEIVSVPVSRVGRIAVVDVAATLAYKANIPTSDYPDIRPIVEDVRTFVRNYPDPKAYFEVIAKEAAVRVLAATPAVASITVVLVIHTDETRSYRRSVRASVSR